jgi:hypothetical protein
MGFGLQCHPIAAGLSHLSPGRRPHSLPPSPSLQFGEKDGEVRDPSKWFEHHAG